MLELLAGLYLFNLAARCAPAIATIAAAKYRWDCIGREGVAHLTMLQALRDNPTGQAVYLAGKSAEVVAQRVTERNDSRVENVIQTLRNLGVTVDDQGNLYY